LRIRRYVGVRLSRSTGLKFLKSQTATEYTIENDFRAGFWEYGAFLARACAFEKIHREKISTVSPLLNLQWKKTMELAFEHTAPFWLAHTCVFKRIHRVKTLESKTIKLTFENFCLAPSSDRCTRPWSMRWRLNVELTQEPFRPRLSPRSHWYKLYTYIYIHIYESDIYVYMYIYLHTFICVCVYVYNIYGYW